MADPKAAAPDSESDDDLFGDDYLKYLLPNPDPGLEDDMPPLDLQLALKSDENTPLPVDEIGDPDPFDDPAVWHLFNRGHGDGNNGAGSSHAGPSGTSSGGTEDCYYSQPEDWNYFVPRVLPNWPAPPLPYNCSCCQVLREIIHTHVETNHTTKLELHGRVGMVSHAILDTQHNLGAVPSNGEHRYQMFDFCKKSIHNVKDFLQQYCEGRRLAGYIMYQDPLAMFYEAVCVGIEFNGNVNAETVSENPGQTDNKPKPKKRRAKSPKTGLAAQCSDNGVVRETGEAGGVGGQTRACRCLGTFAEDDIDEFVPTKARPEFNLQPSKISQQADTLWVKVRRGDHVIKPQVRMVPLKGSMLQRKFTIQATTDDRHVVVLGDLNLEQCTELQDNFYLFFPKSTITSC
ncbi:hypothetical protein ACJRO7_013758 [Eucalyptus globulus]|uniref:Uncharacterized protein n=1 Tax=Eucalyptus globulus TaxID=34317 RepID=A0ABD3L8J7_EUCGL